MGKVCVIIAAAGKGSRMGIDFNKQFIMIKGKPLLWYTLSVFCCSNSVDEIFISARESEIDYIEKNIVRKYDLSKVTRVISGGKERQESVYNALKLIPSCEIVIIHDGARPFIDNDIIDNGIEYARNFGGSACGVSPKDTIKIKSHDNFSAGTLKRDELFCVQTPQCFKYDLILDCYKKASKIGKRYTDDTSVFEDFGHKVYLYEGSYNNIKITTPEDLIIANRIIEENFV